MYKLRQRKLEVPKSYAPVVVGLTVPVTVELSVRTLLALNVVNAPAAADVVPIAGGLARYVLKPAPLTVELADKVVNAPDPATVEPIGPGLANVAPPSSEAFKLLTCVVDDTTNGAVPVVFVDVIVVNLPVLAVVAPIAMLSILPVLPELIVIVPAPVVVSDWLFVVVFKVIAPVAVSDVPVIGPPIPYTWI